jgi:hypothetical protein
MERPFHAKGADLEKTPQVTISKNSENVKIYGDTYIIKNCKIFRA